MKIPLMTFLLISVILTSISVGAENGIGNGYMNKLDEYFYDVKRLYKLDDGTQYWRARTD